jgi:3-hydroxybutyryl-CoA dehydratase
MKHDYTIAELTSGLSESFSVTITQSQVDSFIAITGDDNPIHVDLEYCKTLGLPGTLVHGFLTGSFLSTLVGKYLPGKSSRLLSSTVSWPRPVFVGDTLSVQGTVTEISLSVKSVELKVKISNQAGKTVASGNLLVEVLK